MHLSIWGKGHAMYVTKSFSICISYFIFHTMQHWKKRRCLYFMFVPFFIAYTISYVQISYVHLYAQVTIGRTYFSGILFFSSIKNVVSSISTGVPLKIFQHSLSYSTKPIFLRFIVFFTVNASTWMAIQPFELVKHQTARWLNYWFEWTVAINIWKSSVIVFMCIRLFCRHLSLARHKKTIWTCQRC